MASHDNPERTRLEAQRAGRQDWRLWGPYLAERAWGTVREDYSAEGAAWEHFSFEQAHARVFRWSEDGIAGLCDVEQRLIFALALWNGRDPLLKERLFGLTGNQGNHGEDVKECYFHLDATPTASWLRYLYKYPQRPFPYAWLVAENARRGRAEPPVSLHEAGVFDENRYWDVETRYAKADPDCILIRLFASNRGPETASIWLLPTLWFRNTWNWGDGGEKPVLCEIQPPRGAAWAVRADHPTLGTYYLYGRRHAQRLFTDNETNTQVLWGQPNAHRYTKDAFHRYLVQGEEGAI
ncbi:MAG: MGH1-like glycoside hydrolase domain-containing protein, partial [Thiobacillaceae bacterium]